MLELQKLLAKYFNEGVSLPGFLPGIFSGGAKVSKGGKLPQGRPPGHPVESPLDLVFRKIELFRQSPDITHFLYSACIPQSPVILYFFM